MKTALKPPPSRALRSADAKRGSRVMRSGAWLVGPLALALAALPLAAPVGAQVAAQGSSTPACGKIAGTATGAGLWGLGTYRPLEAEKRLFFPLTDLGDGVLELRYLVEGAPYLTETVDLSSFELPHLGVEDSQAPGRAEMRRALGRLVEADRVIELLALRPDLVSQLHKLAGDGSRIHLEVVYGGELVATLSFAELVERSAELRQSQVVPVVVQSVVEGPGDRGRPVRPITTRTYLEDCADCTTSTPCDTECGWDEGKGGPVTCGEYGVCQPATCDCLIVSSEYWTGWYLYGFYPASPAQYECLYSWLGGSRWHRLYTEVFRRDRIQRRQVCPNCPSCLGCYIEEVVIGYQLAYDGCWLEEIGSCYPGYKPCCSDLCEVGPFTPCYSWC